MLRSSAQDSRPSSSPFSRALVVLALAVGGAIASGGGSRSAPAMASTVEQSRGESLQRIERARYRVLGRSGPLGFTELTRFRRADGSETWLARERMEFWGPVLDRFVSLTFDADGHFATGHWVGTSRYSRQFTYTFHHDGRAIRGDWEDDVRGKGRSEVPAALDAPLIGFWGPLESLLLRRFDARGPDTQTFEAIDVEDSHHRALRVSVQHVGREMIDVPAGRVATTRYRSERFGTTDHWIDDEGWPVRWVSEGATYRWDLESVRSDQMVGRPGHPIAAGEYNITSTDAQGPRGTLSWTVSRGADGRIHMNAEERLTTRTSRFEGTLDDHWQWEGTSEQTLWLKGEADAPPETHDVELFFFRTRIHMLRLRDRAYPLLQSVAVDARVPFVPVSYPIAALAWLRTAPRRAGSDQALTQFAHIGSRFRGNGLEVQPATLRYSVAGAVRAPDGALATRRYRIRYDGGWEDATLEFVADDRGIPVSADVNATEGPVTYRLTRLQVVDAQAFAARQ